MCKPLAVLTRLLFYLLWVVATSAHQCVSKFSYTAYKAFDWSMKIGTSSVSCYWAFRKGKKVSL